MTVIDQNETSPTLVVNGDRVAVTLT